MSCELDVYVFCNYPPYRFPPKDLYDQWAFIYALKGWSLKDEAWIDLPSRPFLLRLNDANLDDAIDWFGEMVGTQLEIPTGPKVFVPVPPSRATSREGVVESRIWHIAQAVANNYMGAKVQPLLWWKEKHRPAHKGGTRRPAKLYAALVVARARNVRGDVYLIDDVITTGGHIRVCEAALRVKLGCHVQAAICAAVTVPNRSFPPVRQPFRVRQFSLARYHPSHDEEILDRLRQ